MVREAGRALKRHVAPIVVILIVVIGGIAGQVSQLLPRPAYKLIQGSDDIFPSFGVASNLSLVRVPPNTDHSTLLTLYSLQGLVNRQGARVYLDTEGENNLSFLLPFLEGRYGVHLTPIDINSFLSGFSSLASGLVVYNPAVPDSVNVATVIAGIDSYLLVDPASVDTVSGLTGLKVQLDLREKPWAGLGGIQLYRKSFQEFYAFCNPNLLAILPPDQLGVRDYLIAAKVWAFHLLPGPFSSQENIDFIDEVLAATPHDIPILGWFEMPTLTEENFLIQQASRYGKFFVGGEFVPNLSCLSALGPPELLRQKRTIPPPPTLADDGIYVNFAVPDGDNLDFVSGKMHDLWQDGARGSVPITWSISPLLVDLAPSLLDYYYFSASGSDSFVAAPSGSGYIYPGFTPGDDLREYLERAKRKMVSADLDTIWLLNSFRAYEIPYDEDVLEAYTTTLAPRGILLDYADQAVTRDVWMQGSQGSAASVISSTHLWSGVNNLIGKMMADIDAAPSSPHFFLVTIYPWTIGIGDGVKTIETIRNRYGDRVHTVSIENLLSLVTQSFLEEASKTISDIDAQPFSAIDFWDRNAAVDELGKAFDHLARGETSLAGYHAYLSLEMGRRALATGTILFLAIVMVALLSLLLVIGRFRRRAGGGLYASTRSWLLQGVASAALFYLFFGGLQKALDCNFWTYASVFIGGALIIFTPRLQSLIEKAHGRNAWPVEATVLAASGLFLLWEPWAFVPFACAIAMLLFRLMGKIGRETLVLFFGLGVAAAAIIEFDWISLAVFGSIVAILCHLLRPVAPSVAPGGRKEGTTGVSFAATTLALMVVWTMLYQNRYFSEKMNGGLDLLHGLSAIALVAAPVIAIVAWRNIASSRRIDAVLTLLLTTALWVALWFAQGLIIVSALIAAMAVLVSWSFISASSRVDWTAAATTKFTANLLILGAVVLILIRLPGVVYSLYVVRGLPAAVEYILYTPPLLMIFALIDIVQTEALFRAARRGTARAGIPSDQTA